MGLLLISGHGVNKSVMKLGAKPRAALKVISTNLKSIPTWTHSQLREAVENPEQEKTGTLWEGISLVLEVDLSKVTPVPPGPLTSTHVPSNASLFVAALLVEHHYHLVPLVKICQKMSFTFTIRGSKRKLLLDTRQSHDAPVASLITCVCVSESLLSCVRSEGRGEVRF